MGAGAPARIAPRTRRTITMHVVMAPIVSPPPARGAVDFPNRAPGVRRWR